MTFNFKRRNVAAIVTVLATVGVSVVGVVAPASASDDAVTVPMHFVPMTEANASWAGYEVRTNPDGTKYGVPIGTPEGSHEKAVKVQSTNDIQPSGIVTGNCGTSTVLFKTKTAIYTAYTIFASYGKPISHN
jgi:hypothetical protein